MVSTFKAVNAQGYHQIMGRFSTRLAFIFELRRLRARAGYSGCVSKWQAGRVPVLSRLGLDL